MSDTKSYSTRLTPGEAIQLKALAQANNVSPSTAMRLSINLMVERAAAESGQITEPALSAAAYRKKQREDQLIFNTIADPLLKNLKPPLFENRYQRGHILDDITSADRSLVSTIARAARLDVDCRELITAIFRDYLEANPAAVVWPVTRQQLVWLEYRWNPSHDHASISAAVDRLDDVGRWRRMRFLMQKARKEKDVQLSDVWKLTDEGWRIPSMKYIRKQTQLQKGGGTERPYIETDEPPPPELKLGEERILRNYNRSAKIKGEGGQV